MRSGAELSSDYFLKNPPVQPKKEVADYVESCGIAVPRRFPTLADALSFGQAFIMRSEHPQDYFQASGLVDSRVFNPNNLPTTQPIVDNTLTENRVRFTIRENSHAKRVLQNHLDYGINKLPQDEAEDWMKFISQWPVITYCRLNGKDPVIFKTGISYSYWQFIDGLNQSVIADNTVPNRYHIYSSQGRYNYGSYIFEGGKITVGDQLRLPKRTNQDFQSLVDFYEKIRNLSRFADTHCPLIEIQTQGQEHYFLQYLRTRDFKPADFKLDRKPTPDECEAMLVRGATPVEGLKLTMQIYYRETPNISPECGLDYTGYDPFTETVVLKTRVLIIAKRRYRRSPFNYDEGHLTRSSLFKPEMSLVVASQDINDSISNPEKHYERANLFPQVPIEVVSDGRRAFVKKVA